MAPSVVALIAAYNEEDIIGQVVRALIDDGIQVYFIDHHSTDGTLAAVQACSGKGLMGIESFPAARPAARGGHRFTWEAILQRKEELALSIDADWFIHHDADEFRESPWPNETLADGIARADAAGYNAIDFEVLNFWPTGSEGEGADIRKRLQYYEPAGVWDRVQIKCWKKTRHPIALARSGGHNVEFVGRRVCPVRFLLRHYPIRSQSHGERKVFRERKSAFDPGERARGWHVQYDAFAEGSSFVRPEALLRKFDPDAVRLELLTRHRDVERLEQTLAANQREADRLTDAIVEVRRHLTAQDAQMEELRRARSDDAANAEALGQHLRDQDAELERLRAERIAWTSSVSDLEAHLRQQDAEIERIRAAAAEQERRREGLAAALAAAQAEAAQRAQAIDALRAEQDRQARALGDMTAERDRFAQDVDTARRLAESQAAAVDRLRRERDRVHRDLDALRAQLLAQDVEADRLRREATDLEGERARVVRELAAKDRTIEYLLASRSWRLTGPLRAADRWMRGRASESTGRGLAVANLPVSGGIRLAGDVTGFWADGWAGSELRMRLLARRGISGLVISGRVPRELGGQTLRLEARGRIWSHQAGPGSFAWTVDLVLNASDAVDLRVLAERSWRPSAGGASSDARDLAWSIQAIKGRR